MSIQCKYCGKNYDSTIFEFNKSITCVCGKLVTFKHEQIKDKVVPARKTEEDQDDKEAQA